MHAHVGTHVLFVHTVPHSVTVTDVTTHCQAVRLQVHCCWNGMAVLNAAPFTKHGLRFRAGVEVEGDVRETRFACNVHA